MERKSGAHAPTPWSHYDDTGPDGKTGRHEIVAIGKTVARIYATKGMEAEDAANAALIVKAVNAFDPLVSALRDVESTHINDDGSCGLCGSDDVAVRFQAEEYNHAHEGWCPIIKVRAALSLAKDGTK
jgi:hypothetical protein